MIVNGDDHGGGIEAKDEVVELDDVAQEHQDSAGQNRRVINPHRKFEAGDAAFVQVEGSAGDLQPAIGEAEAKSDRNTAVECFDPSLSLRRQQPQDDVGPDVAIGPDQLARRQEDGPDGQIDDDLFAIDDVKFLFT